MIRVAGMILFCLVAPTSHACSISPMGAALMGLSDRASSAQAVFMGEVVELERLDDQRQRAVVDVSRWWEGSASRRTVVLDGADRVCGDYLTVGRPFVFFSLEVVDGEFRRSSWVMASSASGYSRIERALDDLDPRAFINGRQELVLGMTPDKVRWLLGHPEELSTRNAEQAWRYVYQPSFLSCEYLTAWFSNGQLDSVTVERTGLEPECELKVPRVNWDQKPDPPVGVRTSQHYD